MQFADVIVDHRVSRSSTLTYSILPESLPYISVGTIVLVPIGTVTVHGVISKLRRHVDGKLATQLRSIKSVIYPYNFVPLYLIEAVFDLERTYGYPANEILFRLLPELPRRPQNEVNKSEEKTGSKFQCYSYGLAITKRLSLYQAVWDKLHMKNQSLLIICATQSQSRNIEDFFHKNKINILVFSELSSKEKREYYFHSLSSQKPIVYIGSRGALATSLQNVGAIIIDEPWLPGHKDDRSPRFWTAIIANALCLRRKIPLLLGSSLIWPEDLIFNSKIFSAQIEYSPIELLIERSRDESSSILQNIALDNDGDVSFIYYPTRQSLFWCESCNKSEISSSCPICRNPTSPFSTWNHGDVLKILDRLHFKNQIPQTFSVQELDQIKSSKVVILVGFDALLSIIDYRASIYIESILTNLRSKASRLYLVTKRPEPWTSLISFANTYNVQTELVERKKQQLPPYSLPLIVSSTKQSVLEKLTLEMSSQYKGDINKKENQFSRFLLLDKNITIPRAWYYLRDTTIDVFPNYINEPD
jgi:primosomal protein N'